MKKRFAFLTLIIIVCLAGCFAALISCGPPSLAKPTNVKIDEVTLNMSWTAVDGARGYKVKIDGKEKVVRKTVYSLETLEAGDHTVAVKALGDGRKKDDSAYTATMKFHREQESGLKYNLINGKTAYEVSGGGSATGDIVIDREFRGKPVVAIGDSAFYGNNNVTSITIGDNIKSIGARAFFGCVLLETVNIAEGVTSIGSHAFCSNPVLDNVVIPSTVTEIKELTFAYCRGLTSVTLPDTLTAIGASAFSGCTALKKINIPDGVTTIGDEAFISCSAATEITLGSSVESIGVKAFSNNSAAATLVLNPKITEIPESAFQYCKALESVVIPDSVQKIGKQAFSDCSALASITLGNGVKEIGAAAFRSTELWRNHDGNYVYVGKWLVGFKDDSKTKSVEIREDTVGIADYAFYPLSNDAAYFSKLDMVDIPDSVKYIGASAFRYNTNLHYARIGNGVTIIGAEAFYGCNVLMKVDMGSAVETIGNRAFANCTLLETAKLPDPSTAMPSTLKEIGTDAFYKTKLFDNSKSGELYRYGNWIIGSTENVKNVNVPSGVVGVANYAFYRRPNLNSIAFPNSVKYIGKGAMYYCPKLMEVILPKGLEEIRDYTFHRCTQLFGIVIPDGVKYIGTHAFYECFCLTGVVKIPDSVTSMGSSAFYGCALLGHVEIGSGLKEIPKWAFAHSGLAEVTIPDTVVSIGDYAFDSCSFMGNTESPSLRTIDLGNGVESIGKYAFRKMSATELVIPDSVTTIGKYAFRDSAELKSIKLGNGIAEIPDGMLYGCAKLENLEIPNSVTKLGKYIIRGCTSMQSIVIGNNISEMENYALYGNTSLTIYCNVGAEGEGWQARWNASYRPVVWGCTTATDENGNKYVASLTKTADSIANPQAKNGISAPYRAGYVFMGWATSADGTPIYDGEKLAEVRDGTTLYSVWEVAPEPPPEEETPEQGEEAA